MEESADTKKVGKKIDLLTFTKNSGCHSKEIEHAASQWFNILLAHLRYQKHVVFDEKRQESISRRSFKVKV